jgi:hypothetical protein
MGNHTLYHAFLVNATIKDIYAENENVYCPVTEQAYYSRKF